MPLAWSRRASRYQMWHALALLLLGVTGRERRVAAGAWLAGVLLFCGSLYALALGAPRAWHGSHRSAGCC